MAGRASWKGYLKLSLVSCPVKLYPATSSTAGKISFNLLHKDTLNRVQQRYHDPELGEIDRADLVKGYQFEKDKYVVVTAEELDEIEIESSKTVDIDGFVDESQIDQIYLDSTYYLAPDGPIAEETFGVILEAMKRSRKVAIARIVLSGRERLVTIEPITDGFRLVTLRSAKEVREPSSALDKLNVKFSDDMLQMAEQIIGQKQITFAPEAFEDRYEDALLALVKSKISGGQPVIAKAPERGNVVNLMDALKRSIQEERRPPAPSLGKAAGASGKSARKPAATISEPAKPVAKKKSGAAETMDLRDRAVALYGRFSPGVRERLVGQIIRGGGRVARDLTRRSHLLVVGALATTLVDSGALGARLRSAAERGVRVKGERAFAIGLSGEASAAAATFPLSTALAHGSLTRDDADILAAFDLIAIEADNCRFGDAAVLRTAGELVDRGRSRADVVRILTRARDLAPRGRHGIVLNGAGEAALQWQDGLTTLEGQGYFPLDEDNATIDDLFEGAALAEANGELDEAARLYDLCGRADRSDAIAPYNLGNIRLAQGFHDRAVLAYQQALARDATLVEARYNLAQALEAIGKLDAAREELDRLLDADPSHPDAVFNLAQLRMKAGDLRSAKALFERYLALGPPDDWAATARKAITYCAAHPPA